MILRRLKRIKLILTRRIKKRARRSLSKRQRFVLVTLILTLALIITELLGIELRFKSIFILISLTFFLSAWALRESLKWVEWITLLSLPTMFSAATSFFYFLLPPRWLTRLPIAFFYALGIYALLLTENIYSVAAERSIQLLRVAYSIGFLITLVTSFLLFNTIFSLRFSAVIIFLLVFLVTFILTLQSLWSMRLEKSISSKVFLFTFFISLAISEVAFMLAFWPLRSTIWALFLATCFYTLAGIAQQHLLERLFKKTLKEFIGVFIVVFLLLLLTTKWGVRY